jgi:hypothetical protein
MQLLLGCWACACGLLADQCKAIVRVGSGLKKLGLLVAQGQQSLRR